jgi:hypothetical protein
MIDKTNKDDRLLADVMKDFRMEGPSSGFTERVMESIQAESQMNAYRPLIGRAGWIGIAAGFCLLLGLIFMDYDSQVPAESGWLAQQLNSVHIPAFQFSFSDLFSRINLDDPVLFWILTGITGAVLLAFLHRLFETRHMRNLFTL